MKHTIVSAIALSLCGAMLLPSLSAGAAYQSADEIAFRIEGMNTIGTEDPQTQYLTREEAKNIGSLHFGIYIDADRAELSLIGVKLTSDTEQLRFDKDTLQQPTVAAYDTPLTQFISTADGTQEITTNFKPYCLGTLTSMGVYRPGCYSCTMNVDEEENSFTTLWMYGIGQATEFLGGAASNALTFLEFDLLVAPDIAKGTYHIDFETADDAITAEDERLTYIVSDNGTDMVPEYHNMIPTLKGLTFIVEGERGDVTDNDVLNAADAAEVLMYAAVDGAGTEAKFSADAAQEQRLCRQADVNRDNTIDAMDASLILQYVAAAGAGATPSWEELIG